MKHVLLMVMAIVMIAFATGCTTTRVTVHEPHQLELQPNEIQTVEVNRRSVWMGPNTHSEYQYRAESDGNIILDGASSSATSGLLTGAIHGVMNIGAGYATGRSIRPSRIESSSGAEASASSSSSSQ